MAAEGKSTDTTELPTGAAKSSEKKVIATYKHGGMSVRRLLSAADWKRLGAEGEKQMVWEKSNNWVVDITGAHPIVRKYLESDSMFTVEEL